MTVISCIRIFRVDAPGEVETNSVFDVRLVVDDLHPGGQGSHEHNDCWGYVGVQLPVGWTINAEELEYEYYPKQDRTENDGHTNTEYHTGTLEYDAGYVDSCFMNEYLDDGYYYTGFSTMEKKSECMDSIVIKIKIHTDGQLGDKLLTFYIQENGDEDESFGGNPVTGKPLYPVDKLPTRPKPAARTDGDNGENCRSYAEIKVVQGQSTGIQTVTKDASCNVSALGNGQLLVTLSDSRKIGATALVYNMRGQIVTTRSLIRTSNLISGLTPGVYAVAVQKDGVRSIKKAIVK
jgi:hypothetical protein